MMMAGHLEKPHQWALCWCRQLCLAKLKAAFLPALHCLAALEPSPWGLQMNSMRSQQGHRLNICLIPTPAWTGEYKGQGCAVFQNARLAFLCVTAHPLSPSFILKE